MMISLLFGRTRKEEGSKKGRADKYVTFRLTALLHDKFVEKYGNMTVYYAIRYRKRSLVEVLIYSASLWFIPFL